MRKRDDTSATASALSERMNRAFGRPGEADWLDVLKRADRKKAPQWTQRRVLLVTGILALAVGACAGGVGVIPWLSKKVDLEGTPEPLPICDEDDVEAKIFLQRLPGEGESLNGKIVLVNTGEPDCALNGQPKMSLEGNAAKAGRWLVNLPESVFSGNERGHSHPEQTLLGRVYEPWQQTSFIPFHWENWCGPGSGSNGYAGKPSLRLELPNGREFAFPVYRLPGCKDTELVSVIEVEEARDPMYVALRYPLRASISGVEKSKRVELRSGDLFRYEIALTNTSWGTFHFESCPSYTQGVLLWGDESSPLVGAGGIYVLNCRSAGKIEPGETVYFAMELRIPRDALATVRAFRAQFESLARQGAGDTVPPGGLDPVTFGEGMLTWSLVSPSEDLSRWIADPRTAKVEVKIVP